mgnify:CR=1 FL=1
MFVIRIPVIISVVTFSFLLVFHSILSLEIVNNGVIMYFIKYKDYIDHILFTDRDDIAKLSFNKEVSKTMYNNNDLLDKVLETVREKRKRNIP